MGGTIHAYYDCGTYVSTSFISIDDLWIDADGLIVSPYSFFAFTHLEKVRGVLASHGVRIEYVPLPKDSPT